jgi:hypothetical protein
MPDRIPSPDRVASSPTRKLPWAFTWSRLKSGLNSLKDSAPGPCEAIRKRLLSPRLGWIGVVLRGWSIWDWKSSLTRAISWRGRTAYESASRRWAEKLVGSVLTEFHPSTSARSWKPRSE